MDYKEISSNIWATTDDVLRGDFKPSEYGRIILPFVVLRRLDSIIEPQKDDIIKFYNDNKDKLSEESRVIQTKFNIPFYNHSKYDLSRLLQDATNIYQNFNNYLDSFSKNIESIISNFELSNIIDRLQKGGNLYILIERITAFNLNIHQVDNHTMGLIYEELLRRFSEMANEESGDHYTPRDAIRALVKILFSSEKEKLQGKGVIKSIYDPCVGTGGMLTVSKNWIKENINNDINLNLYGQELNPHTFATCKSDFLISGEDEDNIKGPPHFHSSLSEDAFVGKKFDYMISNPPYGVSWKKDQKFINTEAQNHSGRFSAGLPAVSDGQLLFLQHQISKMEERGCRIGIVFNASPLFSGDAGSGASNIRKWIIENDWLEAIIALPEQIFFNTGIATYFWILTNKKEEKRKGKVQLINGVDFWTAMTKSLGNKRRYISDKQADELTKIYEEFIENEYSQIKSNNFFGYKKVQIEQAKIENNEPQKDKKGNLVADPSKRDHERIPLEDDVDKYFESEVKPHLPDSWMNRDKDKVGYEINFTKYFYKFKPFRPLEDITQDLLKLDEEMEGLMEDILQK